MRPRLIKCLEDVISNISKRVLRVRCAEQQQRAIPQRERPRAADVEAERRHGSRRRAKGWSLRWRAGVPPAQRTRADDLRCRKLQWTAAGELCRGVADFVAAASDILDVVHLERTAVRDWRTLPVVGLVFGVARGHSLEAAALIRRAKHGSRCEQQISTRQLHERAAGRAHRCGFNQAARAGRSCGGGGVPALWHRLAFNLQSAEDGLADR